MSKQARPRKKNYNNREKPEWKNSSQRQTDCYEDFNIPPNASINSRPFQWDYFSMTIWCRCRKNNTQEQPESF